MIYLWMKNSVLGNVELVVKSWEKVGLNSSRSSDSTIWQNEILRDWSSVYKNGNKCTVFILKYKLCNVELEVQSSWIF